MELKKQMELKSKKNKNGNKYRWFVVEIERDVYVYFQSWTKSSQECKTLPPQSVSI